MKWKIKSDRFPTIRTICKFAFLPIKIGDEIRWLEEVIIRQELKIKYALVPDGPPNMKVKYWDNVAFLN